MYGQVVKILSAAEPSICGINSADEEGWAPLHTAASSGNVEIVEILLSRGDFYQLLHAWFWSLLDMISIQYNVFRK